MLASHGMGWVESAEPQLLRRCVSHLLALSALRTVWNNSDATQIAESIATALIPILDADVIHLSVAGASREGIEVTRTAAQVPAPMIEPLTVELHRAAAGLPDQTGMVIQPAGNGTLRLAWAPIGFKKAAWLLAGSRRQHFPDEAQRFLLGVAANEATLGLLRRRAEINERRLLSLIERAPDFIAVTSLEGIPQAINPAGLKLLGLSGIEEAWEHSIFEFVAPDDQSSIRASWRTVIDQGSWSGEITFRHFGPGELIPFLVDWFRIDDPRTGEPMNLAAVSRDLRDQKQFEWKLQQLNAQLERRVQERTEQLAAAHDELKAEMVERKRSEARQHALQLELAHAGRLGVAGEMAGALAHELNQPLTAVANSVSAARRLLSQERGTVYDIIVEAEEQVVRAAQIIRRLRDVVSGTGTEKQPEALQPMIEEAVALALAESAAQGLQVDIRFDESAIVVCVDKIQIQQVIVNLVRNAIEAISNAPRKSMWISTDRLDAETVEIAISDSGPGLAKEVLSNLFQPFNSTKHDGMGLGLSICRTIVEAHGGELRHEPRSGEGTTFRFTLRTWESRGLPTDE
ncbi:MAG: hypothetical protein NVS4B4_00060 [Bradyrhizobium sp.]